MSKRIVWLFFGEHRWRTIMPLAIDTLTSAGYRVIVIDAALEQTHSFYEHIALKCSFSLENGRSLTGIRRVFRYLLLSLKMLALVLKRRPNFIIITWPQVVPVGWLGGILLRARLIYYSFEIFGEQHGSRLGLFGGVEKIFLKRGIDALITQNEERARIYVQERDSRVSPDIVHNYKRHRKVERSGKLRTLLALPDGLKVVLYEGVLAQGRCLDKLIQSAVYLPEDTKLVFIGKVSQWWTEEAGTFLSLPSIKQKIHVLGWIPQENLLDYVADADVGVIIYDNLVRNNYYCEPGKLSDYVLSGVPVVAPEFPTIAPIVKSLRIGTTFTGFGPEEIAQAIKTVLSTPREMWKPALEQAGKKLVWETQAQNFLKAVRGN